MEKFIHYLIKFQFIFYALLVCIICNSLTAVAQQKPIRIGSKIFTEGYLLGEIVAQKLESKGFPVERALGLGATGVTEEAMKSGVIDIIVDYTGSLSQAHLNGKRLNLTDLKSELYKKGFTISNSLGFSNTYTLAARSEWLEKNKIKTFSDLIKLPSTTAAFTPEFTSRVENWPGLKKLYGFNNLKVLEMDHQLAYESIKSNQVDLIEAYSTDAKLKEYQLVSLVDDKSYFPDYLAVIVARNKWIDANPEAWKALIELEDSIKTETMIELNSQIDLEKKSFSQVAAQFLGTENKSRSTLERYLKPTLEHLFLVLVPIIAALIIGIPMGYLSYRIESLASYFGALSTLLQTIPGLALLAFLIPLTGIGLGSAIIALTLYALLPIFVNTHQGLKSISSLTHMSALTLKMTWSQKLWWVELPLAMPMVLSGIQTALVTTVANATLAALIGSGGYGKKIIAGLAVNDYRIVLEGAIPSAIMALVFYFIFEFIKKKTNRFSQT